MTRVVVNQGAQTSSSVVVKRGGDITLQSLKNVNTTDLQDGYTLVYDSETGKWISQSLSESVTINTVDGGTY